VLLDVQVQHTHAAHQHLPGVGIDAPGEGRILALEAIERVGQLVLVSGRVRLDAHGDDRFRELNLLQYNRMLLIAQRIARDRILRT
jgi:hypothetical protein